MLMGITTDAGYKVLKKSTFNKNINNNKDLKSDNDI